MSKGNRAQIPFLRHFFRGEIHFGFWNIVSKALGVVNTFLIVSYLTVYQYGVFQLLLSFYAFFAVVPSLADSVVGNDINRYIGEKKESSAKKLYLEYNISRLAVAFTLMVLLIFGADIFSFKYSADFLAHVKYFGVLLFAESAFSSLRALLKMRLEFASVASRSSAYKFIQFVFLGISVLFFGFTVKTVILSMVAGSIASSVLLISPSIRSWKKWSDVQADKAFYLWRLIKSYGKWEIFRPLIADSSLLIQNVLIKILISTEAVAVFSVAQTVVSTLTTVWPTKTLATLVPMQIVDRAKMRKIYLFGTKYLLAISIATAVVALVAVPIMIHIIFPKYAVSLPYFRGLLLTLPIMALGVMGSTFLVVYRRQKFLFFQKIFKIIFAIPLYLVLLPAFQIWGLVIHSIILSLILLFIMFYYAYRSGLDFSVPLSKVLKVTDEDRAFFKYVSDKTFTKIKRRLGR